MLPMVHIGFHGGLNVPCESLCVLVVGIVCFMVVGSAAEKHVLISDAWAEAELSAVSSVHERLACQVMGICKHCSTRICHNRSQVFMLGRPFSGLDVGSV